jgi:tetratricopeptide (TPR) repeat protein
MKDYDNAVSVYGAGIKALPESTALWLALGNTYNARGFFIDPRCGSPHAGIGASPGTKDDKFVREQWIAKADEDYQRAIGAFENVLALNVKSVAAMDGMAYSYHRQFKHADAIVWANRALELAPNDFGRYMMLGNSYKGLRDFDTALTYYERAIALKPKEEHAYKYLWEAYAGKRDWDGAIARLSQAVADYPTNVEAMMRLGLSYEQKKDPKTALFWYEQALKVDPERGEVYKYAAPHYKKSDPAKAQEYARLAEWYKPK